MAAAAAICTFILTFGRNFLTWLYNTFIDMAQAVFNAFIDFVITVVALFPAGSTLSGAPSAPTGPIFDAALKAINWVFPVSYFLTVVAFVIAGMLAYWVIAPLARWVKLLT